ncbi:tetratricopeptide repeat protein [Variovorax robiniae]|uniref:Tetratricopeptide repeat protein n=1 Tax=Variovorax robiniae TaxID=1836199 RepID=A0ABU8XB62_9BURK
MNDELSAVHERPASAAALPRAMGGAGSTPAMVRFAGFEFDFARDQLRRGDTVIPLSPKPSALLRYFLAHPQRLIGKSELLDNLWADVVVTDDSVVQCVGELRSRMGKDGALLITTHPRRGYMLEADVWPVAPGATLEGAIAAPSPVAPIAPAAHASPVTPGKPVDLFSRVESIASSKWSVPLRRPWHGLALALVLSVLTAVGGAIYLQPTTAPYRIDDELARRYSIVVTPFQDLGRTPAPKLVRDGLVEAVAAELAQRQNSQVTRSATPAGARYAMSGSFVARGAGVAIDLQVKSVADGAVVWADHYDYPDANDPGMNLDAARRATSGLRLRFAELHRARVSVPDYRFDPADLAVSGWDDIDRRQTAEDVSRGRARFEQALRADPDSVTALTGLGAALMSQRFGNSGEPNPADVGESERVSARAIGIAPNNSAALINWANVLVFRGQPRLALPFYEKAVLIAPSNANAHVRYAWVLLSVGRADEARSHIDNALRIGHRDPRVTASAWSLAAVGAFVQGNDDEAYALSQRALAERPTFGIAFGTMAAIDALHGRTAEAQKNMAEHLRLVPHTSVARYIANNPSGSDSFLAARNRLVAGMRAAGLPEQ